MGSDRFDDSDCFDEVKGNRSAPLSGPGLPEPMGAQFKTPDGREGSLSGFFVVSREKLKKISAEKLAELVQTDELEMIYLHLNSLGNLRKTISRAAAPQAGVALA